MSYADDYRGRLATDSGHQMTPDQAAHVDNAASLVLAAGGRKDTLLLRDGSLTRFDVEARVWTAYTDQAAHAGPIIGAEGRTATWGDDGAWHIAEADGSDALPASYRQELERGYRSAP